MEFVCHGLFFFDVALVLYLYLHAFKVLRGELVIGEQGLNAVNMCGHIGYADVGACKKGNGFLFLLERRRAFLAEKRFCLIGCDTQFFQPFFSRVNTGLFCLQLLHALIAC